MSINEERKKILNMIAEKKITAEEGVQLLDALRSATRKTRDSASVTSDARFLRVRVTSIRSGKVKANVNIPMSLVNVGLRIGARFTPELDGVDFEEMMEAIQHGARGKIMEVEDKASDEYVEIYVE